MFLSVFDMFKIGIGPSSSHTVGPMVAAGRFIDEMRTLDAATEIQTIDVELFGSLALTGRGHHTDKAVMLGLLQELPDRVAPKTIDDKLQALATSKRLHIEGLDPVKFDPDEDIAFNFLSRPKLHPNTLCFRAKTADGKEVAARTYFSVGGGFVMNEQELAEDRARRPIDSAGTFPYPFKSAEEMLLMGRESGKTIAEMKRENESEMRADVDIDVGLDGIWQAMQDCIASGIAIEGELPGGLKVMRRAKRLAAALERDDHSNVKFDHAVMDWLSLFALAVNEENAGGGRIVTAPTNGAAGVIPAVLKYYQEFCPGADVAGVRIFLLTAAAIGGLIKHNASISGAEVGCQGEVGSAASMAAAGLAAALGGTNEQIENAAEIALEHHLGMTCDPIGGLVQVPCIERNGLAAIKAVGAASLALRGDGSHIVPLDSAIKTMYETGRDMSAKYKETSEGGLAVNVVEC